MEKTPKILIVEDEVIIAMDLEDIVGEIGADIAATCHSLPTAMQLAESLECDAAILDVDVNGQAVFPVAEKLRERGIPFLFSTGHFPLTNITDRFADTPICPKPVNQRNLRIALLRLLETDAA